MNSEYKILSGALFYSSKRHNFWEQLNASGLIQQVIDVLPGWKKIDLLQPDKWREESPLADTIVNTLNFWIRQGSEDRLLVVSDNKEQVWNLLKEIGLENWLNNTPTVDIKNLMDDLSQKPRITEYSLGAVYARVGGYGQALRTIILYGDDIASSTLYISELKAKISPYRLSLRSSKTSQWHEVLSIGANSELSFPYRDKSSLNDVDTVMRVISKELKRLDWGVE